jgi:hypothetical protein
MIFFLQSLVALLIILAGDVFDQGGQFCTLSLDAQPEIQIFN